MDRTQAKEEIRRDAVAIGKRIWGEAVGGGRFRCPKCGDGEQGPEHAGRGWFRCYACGLQGDIFTLYMETKGCGFRQAMDDLAQAGGIALENTRPGSGEELTPEMRRQYAKGRDAGYLRGYSDAMAGRPNAVELRESQYRERQAAGIGGGPAWGRQQAPAPQPQPAAPANQYGDDLPF